MHVRSLPASATVPRVPSLVTRISPAPGLLLSVSKRASASSVVRRSFMETFGSRPLVTARVVRAVRSSWSSSSSRSFFVTSVSIFAVSRSRNAAIARCSTGAGSGVEVLATQSSSRLSTVAPSFFHSTNSSRCIPEIKYMRYSATSSEPGTSALRSWFSVTSRPVSATGMLWARIPDRRRTAWPAGRARDRRPTRTAAVEVPRGPRPM
jgi:hypothetical protein